MASRGSKLPAAITRSKVLLVEGDTPEHFFRALLRHLAIEDTIEVLKFGGITELGEYMRTVARATGFRQNVRSLAVVRDAEADAVAARQSVKAAIAGAGLHQEVRTAYFILPDNTNPGNIETLCLNSVTGTPVSACVDQFAQCAAGSGNIVWPEGYAAHKALVQIYAATLSPPQPFAGLASYKGAWPWDSPVFVDLIAFLQAI